jgi:hypothetical protein
MSKCALLYFVIGITITTASYAFFNMPQQMMNNASQMVMPQQPQKCVCVCQTK